MRSKLMRGLALASAVALIATASACSNDDSDTQDAAITSEVEVFTWLTTATEKAGLDNLVSIMRRNNPSVMFENAAVSGGAGANARSVLADRLEAFDPPDSFQSQAGMELYNYIRQGQVRDVTFIYDKLGLRDVLPEDLVELLTVDGKIYSVPANVHRANMMWANPTVIEEAGISLRTKFTSIDEWIEAMKKIEKTGVLPIVIGEPWMQVQLLETILLSNLGVEGYKGLWDGSTAWSSAQVTKSITQFKTILSLSNKERDEMDWPEALNMVRRGEAAYFVMSDWAAAELENSNVTIGNQVLAIPVPGTDQIFDFSADSFTLPVGAPNPPNAQIWLETVGSVEGQIAYNRAKGSAPARTDIPPAEFSPYQQSAMGELAKRPIVPSLAHGAAAPPQQLDAITQAVTEFSHGNLDVEGLQDALAKSDSAS